MVRWIATCRRSGAARKPLSGHAESARKSDRKSDRKSARKSERKSDRKSARKSEAGTVNAPLFRKRNSRSEAAVSGEA